MLETAREHFTRYWANIFIPGFLIFLAALAARLVGIGQRDDFDLRPTD